jgi:hypothetical protein
LSVRLSEFFLNELIFVYQQEGHLSLPGLSILVAPARKKERDTYNKIAQTNTVTIE